MRALRVFRNTQWLKSTSPYYKLVVSGLISVQLQRVVWPESNIARAYSSTSPPPPRVPPPSAASLLPPSAYKTPFGPTSFDFTADVIRDISLPAIALYREFLTGNQRAIEDFAGTIWQAWSNFTQELKKQDTDAKLIAEHAKQYSSKLSQEAQSKLGVILPILGVRNIEQIFEESAAKHRDSRTKTVADGVPRPLRILSRLRELRQWNDLLSQNLDPSIHERAGETSLDNIPAHHRKIFVEQLQTALPNLDAEVVKLMGEVAEFRMQLGLLRPYIQKGDTLTIESMDKKFKIFAYTSVLANEWQTEKKKQGSVLPYEKYVNEKIKQKYPDISTHDMQQAVLMFQEFARM